MMTDDAAQPNSAAWDFPTLAYLWDPKTRAIMAGADRLETLSGAEREHCLTALIERVLTLTRSLDDGWLVSTAIFMIDDLFKSYFVQFRWSPNVDAYIAATAGVVMRELTQRGFVLNYVIDNTQREDLLDDMLIYLPAIFGAAGLWVFGPQLAALELMEREDDRPRDVRAIPSYRAEGHDLADQLISRCHRERLSSVYLNLDLDDDTPGLALDVALSQANTPGTIVVFRDQPPVVGTTVEICAPPGVTLPEELGFRKV